jgi:hypothetical protein
MTKQEQIDYWIEQYLQAKQDGNARLIKICEAIIIKLNGKIPRI